MEDKNNEELLLKYLDRQKGNYQDHIDYISWIKEAKDSPELLKQISDENSKCNNKCIQWYQSLFFMQQMLDHFNLDDAGDKDAIDFYKKEISKTNDVITGYHHKMQELMQLAAVVNLQDDTDLSYLKIRFGEDE